MQSGRCSAESQLVTLRCHFTGHADHDGTAVLDSVSPSLSQSFQYDPGGHVTRGTGVYGTDNYTNRLATRPPSRSAPPPPTR
jgi:hypothetical protein